MKLGRTWKIEASMESRTWLPLKKVDVMPSFRWQGPWHSNWPELDRQPHRCSMLDEASRLDPQSFGQILSHCVVLWPRSFDPWSLEQERQSIVKYSGLSCYQNSTIKILDGWALVRLQLWSHKAMIHVFGLWHDWQSLIDVVCHCSKQTWMVFAPNNWMPLTTRSFESFAAAIPRRREHWDL